MKIKKIIRYTSSLVLAAPIGFVSCGISPFEAKPFDLGLAIPPLSSLNYIKYGTSVNFAHAVVEGLGKPFPPESAGLRNFIATPKIAAGYTEGQGKIIKPFNDFPNWQLNSGILRAYKEKDIHSIGGINKYYKYGFSWRTIPNRGITVSDSFAFSMHDKQVWANGENVTASSFIDSIVYILDTNTGSDLKEKILSWNIKNAREFVDAQNEYAKVFGKIYKNPFGYIKKDLPPKTNDIIINGDKLNWKVNDEEYVRVKKAWTYYQQRKDAFPLQNEKHVKANEEQRLVTKIEKAARELGVYGDEFSSHPSSYNTNPNKFKIIEDPEYTLKNPVTGKAEIMPFQMRVELSASTSFAQFRHSTVSGEGHWLPTNRRFIEEKIGGIEKFGQDLNSFLTAGPFNIKNIVFNTSGNVILEKNKAYHSAPNVLANKIKIFFQDDQNVRISMFEDGYIATTSLNTINVQKLYSGKESRKLVEKTWGTGVYSFILNLDKETNTNKALLDPDFRRALFFAIDRGKLIARSNFDSTLPYYSLLNQEAPAGLRYLGNDDDVQQGYLFADEKTDFGDNKPAVPFFSIDKYALTGISQLFTNFSAQDGVTNQARANAFLNKFKQKNPNQKSISLQFMHDSSTAMVNMGVELQSQLQQMFNGYVKLELKGYPREIYTAYKTSGQFDMTAVNLDYLPKRLLGQNEAFLYGDPIRKDAAKSNGFIASPAGSWTVDTAMQNLASGTFGETEAEVREQLGISLSHWNVIKQLTYLGEPQANETIADLETKRRQQILSFINLESPLNTTEFDSPIEVVELSASLNKFIMYMVPVIPLLQVDVNIKVSRLSDGSITMSNGELSLDTAYDLARKPRADLPGMEIK